MPVRCSVTEPAAGCRCCCRGEPCADLLPLWTHPLLWRIFITHDADAAIATAHDGRRTGRVILQCRCGGSLGALLLLPRVGVAHGANGQNGHDRNRKGFRPHCPHKNHIGTLAPLRQPQPRQRGDAGWRGRGARTFDGGQRALSRGESRFTRAPTEVLEDPSKAIVHLRLSSAAVTRECHRS